RGPQAPPSPAGHPRNDRPDSGSNRPVQQSSFVRSEIVNSYYVTLTRCRYSPGKIRPGIDPLHHPFPVDANTGAIQPDALRFQQSLYLCPAREKIALVGRRLRIRRKETIGHGRVIFKRPDEFDVDTDIDLAGYSDQRAVMRARQVEVQSGVE